jgi:hypothetical protein
MTSVQQLGWNMPSQTQPNCSLVVTGIRQFAPRVTPVRDVIVSLRLNPDRVSDPDTKLLQTGIEEDQGCFNTASSFSVCLSFELHSRG